MSTVIDLGKLRFQFRGTYAPATQYEFNDVVLYGGNAFCYINPVATIGNAPTNTTYWSTMLSGLRALGTWSSATDYQLNDLVVSGSVYYRCILASTNNEPPNATYWEVFASGLRARGTWAATTAYKVNDIVVHLGQTYRCLTNHTSGSNFQTNFIVNAYWERLVKGVSSRGDFADATQYYVGDLVTVGIAPNLDLYIAKADYTSVSSDITNAGNVVNWTKLISGTYSTTVADQQRAFFFAAAL